jgi:toxin secretion/phage lysis holin
MSVLPVPPRVTAFIAAVFAVITHWLGGWTPAMDVLVTIIALDIISGFALAAVQKRLSSKVSWQGLIKKVLIFVMVMLAAQVDLVLGQDGTIKSLVVLAYCASEGLSVIENAVATGLPVPDIIKDALIQLRPEGGRKIIEAVGEDANGEIEDAQVS